MTTIASPPLPTSPRSPAPALGVAVVAVLVLDATAGDPGRLEACLLGLATQHRAPDRLLVVPTADGPDDAVGRVQADPRLRAAVADVRVLPAGPADEGVVDAVVRATTPVASHPGDPGDPTDPGDLAGPTGATWWWLLTPACAPQPEALTALVDGARTSRTAGIVGPKLLDWDDPRRLVEMGQQVTRTGRRIDRPVHGEPDQGQYDHRTDVLAVALTGMLVRSDVLSELHGPDPALGAAGAGLDLGWRAQLAGHRVVVAPAARVRLALPGGVVHPVVEAERRELEPEIELGDPGAPAGRGAAPGEPASVGRRGPRSSGPPADPDPGPAPTSTPRWLVARRGAARRAARRVALTQCAWWVAPLLAVWVAVSSLVSAAALLLLKRPAHAWLELGDLGALTHPVSGVRSRWRGRRTRRVRRSDLAPVFVGAGDSLAYTWDAVQDAFTLQRSRRAAAPSATSTETGPVAEEAEDLTVLPASVPQRIATHPGTLAVLLCALAAAVTFRSALGAGLLEARGVGLTGGELLPVTTDASGLWHLWRDSWHGAGLGTAQEAGPAVGVLAGLTWLVEHLPAVAAGRSPASVTTAWLLLAAMPLSALTAYLAGRVVTRRQWLRGLLALAWGTSPVLAAAVSGGRLTAALGHVLLPLVVAGLGAAASRRSSWTSVFATTLAAAALGALVPLDLVVVIVAGLGLALSGARSRVRLQGLVLAVLPVALLGPWVLQVVDDPRVLLAGAGLLDLDGPPADPWLVALGFPQGGVGLAHALLWAPLVLVALAGLARPPRPGRGPALAALSALTLVGLAAALAAPRLVVGAALDAQGSPVAVTPWVGVGTDLYAVGVLALVLTAWRVVPSPRDRRDGRALLAIAAALVVAAGVVGVAGLAARTGTPALAVGGDGLPAVAVDAAEGPAAGRLLLVGAGADGVTYSVVGDEPGTPLRDLVAAPERTGGPSVTAADPGIGDVVSAVASGTVDDVDGPGLGSRLADVGVGYVSLRTDPSGSLARTLDAAPGLARLGTTDGQTLWRVAARDPGAAAGSSGGAARGAGPVPPARVRVTSAAGDPLSAVPVSGPHAAVDTVLAAGPPGRRLVVAESPQWSTVAQVRVDDTVLEPVAGPLLPTYELPRAGGRLVVDLPSAHGSWLAGQLVLLLVVLFLAVPFGTRRSRRLS